MALSVPLHCFLLLKYIIFSGVCSSRFSCKNCHLTSMWVYVFANCHYETKHLCFCIHTHTPHTCTQMSSGHFSDAAGVCLFCSPRKIRKEVSMAGYLSLRQLPQHQLCAVGRNVTPDFVVSPQKVLILTLVHLITPLLPHVAEITLYF